jgi:hypothetical protein
MRVQKMTGNRSRRKFDNYVRGNPLDADLQRKAYTAVVAKLPRVIFGLIKQQNARLFGPVPTVCESCRTVAQMASWTSPMTGTLYGDISGQSD